MNEQVSLYLEKFPEKIVNIFNTLRNLIFDSASVEPEELLWAKLPSYYVGTSFVRLIAFKDHINIEAKAAAAHTGELLGYKMTPKGMLQIFVDQKIPVDVLKQIFAETLG